MSKLDELIYGEDGIIFLVQSGEDDVVTEEMKQEIMKCAKKTNIKLCDRSEDPQMLLNELCKYIELNMCLVPFTKYVPWIAEFLDRLNFILIDGVEFYDGK